MQETLIYGKLRQGTVKCGICQRRCVVASGQKGICKTRFNDKGQLKSLIYGKVSSVAVDPIEKKPLFHFYPGTQVFSLGTIGCNFHCLHCQNWGISTAEPDADDEQLRSLSPEMSVTLAKRYGCGGIAWTYNEPAIWLEHTLDSAKLAKAAGLYTVYVTNGYITSEALDLMGPYLDAYRVDIKGFNDLVYRRLADVPSIQEILDVTIRAKKQWGMHIEVVTNVIPTLNDDEQQLSDIASWIRDSLGDLTPWHVTRFYPQHKLTNIPATPIATLERAYQIGVKSGLKFVYLGNVPGHASEISLCYGCGQPVIHRLGYQAKLVGVIDGKCSKCQVPLGIRGV